MPAPSSSAPAARLVVFLPCHTLDDFPTWLDDREADDLLAAWTAAWHPRLVVRSGMPTWASVDLPPPAGPLLGIVPRSWDDRFAAQFDAAAADAVLVRGISGRGPLAAAALAAIGEVVGGPEERRLDDFAALGLAALLAELLARRMRTEADLESTGFPAAVAAAAAAAVDGRDDDARAGLAECFRCLEASRARYYPVDAWLVDLVLLAPTTPAARLRTELTSPVPLGIVAEGQTAAALEARDPEVAADLRSRVAAGSVGICSGRWEDLPLDAALPEDLRDSCAAGSAAWERVVGSRPAVFARRAGGGSALLPQVLAGLGWSGAVWGTFDGARLPDPGASRIIWEGAGGATIDALARPPVDARSAAALLTLPERIGDALDHDHVAVTTFAHHAGTASHWHDLLRRIGGWSTVLGTFVTPADLFLRTAGAGTLAAFGPDAFPPTPLPAGDGDPLDAAVEAAAAAAKRIVARSAELRPLVAVVDAPSHRPLAAGPASRGPSRGLAGWWAGPRRAAAEFVLESSAIRVVVHPTTGGILALTSSATTPNRLSQQLALHGPDGYGRMVADSVAAGTTPSGAVGIVSRGRLLDAAGRECGTFVQGASLVPGLPLVALDVDVRMAVAPPAALAEHHVACRFAWHENEEVDVRRSVHGQAVTTERTRFTAPHFVELVPVGRRGAAAAPVTILCGGLPWHVRSSPHVLDTILAGRSGAAARRLAVGIGLERPWDAALELLAGAALGSGPRPGPANVRVTVHEIEVGDGRPRRARIGILESAGSSGTVRLELAAPVAAAAARELDGRPRPGTAVAIEGRAVVVFLRAHEWLLVDLEFGA